MSKYKRKRKLLQKFTGIVNKGVEVLVKSYNTKGNGAFIRVIPIYM